MINNGKEYRTLPQQIQKNIEDLNELQKEFKIFQEKLEKIAEEINKTKFIIKNTIYDID